MSRMVQSTDKTARALPPLTAKEQAVWDACCASDQASPGCYVNHSYILKQSGLPPRSLGGVIASLQKKVYLFAFPARDVFDVEITCVARQALGLNSKRHFFCNHDHCDCRSPLRK